MAQKQLYKIVVNGKKKKSIRDSPACERHTYAKTEVNDVGIRKKKRTHSHGTFFYVRNKFRFAGSTWEELEKI